MCKVTLAVCKINLFSVSLFLACIAVDRHAGASLRHHHAPGRSHDLPHGVPRPPGLDRQGNGPEPAGLRGLLPPIGRHGRMLRCDWPTAADHSQLPQAPPLRVVMAIVLVFIITQLPHTCVLITEIWDAHWAGISDCETRKVLDKTGLVLKTLAYVHPALTLFSTL
ncbi:hypothetical protein WMY93_031645 [Mugilogobius chulae]|uniref:G-protein coupled receptors family 1 profile domain-containing protein n=1 Tax=Mugilogobius chulae TaxID=88201 RepID=A0AAW0MHE8_9GOBI